MCGIAGLLDAERRPIDPGLLKSLCDGLCHRGPDDEAYYLRAGIGLGQRRLSIIDLSGGRQPMSNENGTVWVTSNGEIYNFHELRRCLEGLGHRFATDSDTEVIIHGYEEWGADCVTRLRGMFAFALWDEQHEQLLIARDRVGKKPLFYTIADGQFVFASELQALLRHPAVPREVDPTAIDDYLTYGYIPAPKAAFRGIRKLPPAHYLTLAPGNALGSVDDLRARRYWQLEYRPTLALSEAEAAEGLLEQLTEAVRLRLIADVPLGAMLSGGIDSGVVVALMSRLSDRPVNTFSVGFEEQAYNELPAARLVAQRYGTNHHELIVRAKALEVLPTLVRHYGEPFADSSAVPTYYVAQLIRQHVKVALNGDGGDECFAGYPRYLGSAVADHYHRLPRALRQGVIEPAVATIPGELPLGGHLRQLKRFLPAAALPRDERYLRWVSYFTPDQKDTLYSSAFRQQLNGHRGSDWLLREFAAIGADGLDRVNTLLAVDVRSYLAYDLLVKMDIATMANSLEARSPFLDHQLLEYCARLPSHYKLRGRTLKYLLKRVAADLLPAENLRRGKMGFGAPVGQWMRHELRPLLEEVLLSRRAFERGYFQPAAVQQLVTAHLSGAVDHTFRLWSLLWLELWHREFIDGSGTA